MTTRETGKSFFIVITKLANLVTRSSLEGRVFLGKARQGTAKEVNIMIKKIEITIKGTTALLMHRFPIEPIEAIEKKSKEEQAEIAAYRIPKTDELYIPAIALQRALVSGGTFSKGKGRATLQKPVAACVSIEPEYMGLGVKEYEIDSRAVVVPVTKGRIVRNRPRLDTWEVSFSLLYESDLITEKQIRKIVDDTGVLVGILDFRPERKGMYGKFMVTHWKVS